MAGDEGQLSESLVLAVRPRVSHDEITTYLALRVGRYRLALNGDRVLAILGDVPTAGSVTVHGEALALVDLQAALCKGKRPMVPFAVAFEIGGRRGAIGVDRVNHLRLTASTTLRPVPSFGLKAPDLFAGAVCDTEGLLLVLDPQALGALIAGKEFAV